MMEGPSVKNLLTTILSQQHSTVQIYGLPGTYKTAFLTQIVRDKVKSGETDIYLLDTSGDFPIIRLKEVQHFLQHVVVFHPKTLEDEVLILDDLTYYLKPSSILLIDDIFRHVKRDHQETYHLASYLLATLKKISQRVWFPIFLTNQARAYEKLYPFLQELTLFYLDWHILFAHTKDEDILQTTVFERDQYKGQKNYSINSLGFLEL